MTKRREEYRGIAYEISKTDRGWTAIAPTLPRGYVGHFADTKKDALKYCEREIDIRLDYDGDSELYFMVKSIVDTVSSRRVDFKNMTRLVPTREQMLRRLDLARDIAKRIIETRFPDTKNEELVAKLRAMTEANGCTPNEAAAPVEKLRRLELGS
jgi:hypothetical protein